jgi:protein TonB
VIIEAIIGKDGRIKDAKVLGGQAMLQEAALSAVKQWQYTPTLLNGVPVEVIMNVTVHFKLN